jgi:hypothetical protein
MVVDAAKHGLNILEDNFCVQRTRITNYNASEFNLNILNLNYVTTITNEIFKLLLVHLYST